MRRFLALLALPILAGLAACSTDVDLNAPFQERPVLYAALDPALPVQLIRIQRSFLTINEPNANVAAGERDSTYYKAESLTVTLQRARIVNGQVQTSGQLITLRDTTIAKDTGLFAGTDQVVFATPPGFRLEKLPTTGSFQGYYHYLLTIRHPKLAAPVTALTSVVTPVSVPRGGNPVDRSLLVPYNRDVDGNLVFYTSGFMEVGFAQVPEDSVRIYQIEVRVPVEETLTDGSTRVRPLNWFFTPERTTTATDQIRDGKQDPYAFLDFIRSSLDSTDTRVAARRLLPFTLRISSGNNRLSNFVEANRGYNVLSQTRPFYTNINGGLGVFASRSITEVPCVADLGFYSEARKAKYAALKFRP